MQVDADSQPPRPPQAEGPYARPARRSRGPPRLVRPPDARQPLVWALSPQPISQRKAAACRVCACEFKRGAYRITLQSDADAGASRFYHIPCVPGGLHHQDVVNGLADAPVAVADDVRASRAPARADRREGAEASLELPPSIIAAAPYQNPDWWRNRAWTDAQQLHGATLIEVPKTTRAAYADLKLDLIAEVEAAEGVDAELEQAWMKLSFIDARVLNSSRATGESQTQSVLRRIRQARDNEWEALWREATAKGVKREGSHDKTRAEIDAAVASRVEDLAHANQARRAARAVVPPKPAVTDKARLAELKTLFPSAENLPPLPGELMAAGAPDWSNDNLQRPYTESLQKHIEKMLRKPVRRSAPGPLASRPEHWEVLKYTSDGVSRMAALITRLTLGRVPRGVARGHSVGEIIATQKPNGGIRPIMLSSVLRRVGLAGVARVLKRAAMAAAGPFQLGVGTADGCAKAYRSISALARMRPGKAVMALDVKAAHQSLRRDFMRKEVASLCPMMSRPLDVWYPPDEHTRQWWRTSSGEVITIEAERGVDQGCPLASLAFGISTARIAGEAVHTVSRNDPDVSFFQYAGDTQAHVEPADLTSAYSTIEAKWATAGLELNRAKTKVWTPNPDTPLPADWQGKRVASLRCLGADRMEDGISWTPPAHGTSTSELQDAATKVERFADSLRQLRDAGLRINTDGPVPPEVRGSGGASAHPHVQAGHHPGVRGV